MNFHRRSSWKLFFPQCNMCLCLQVWSGLTCTVWLTGFTWKSWWSLACCTAALTTWWRRTLAPSSCPTAWDTCWASTCTTWEVTRRSGGEECRDGYSNKHRSADEAFTGTFLTQKKMFLKYWWVINYTESIDAEVRGEHEEVKLHERVQGEGREKKVKYRSFHAAMQEFTSKWREKLTSCVSTWAAEWFQKGLLGKLNLKRLSSSKVFA